MKTYSVTHNPSNKEKSKHNVPEEMIIKFAPGKSISEYSSGSSRWSTTRYGFYIKPEELANYKPLYISNGGNGDEVYIVSLYDVCFVKYANICSTTEWTLVYKTEVLDPYGSGKKLFLEIKRGPTTGSQKMFLNVDEMKEYYDKEYKKTEAKHTRRLELMKNTNNGPLSFSTPVKTVKSINMPTDTFKEVKVGDKIYGDIKVLNDKGKSVLSTQSRYVNYVEVYVNGKKVNTIPMSTFGTIMAQNFVLE